MGIPSPRLSRPPAGGVSLGSARGALLLALALGGCGGTPEPLPGDDLSSGAGASAAPGEPAPPDRADPAGIFAFERLAEGVWAALVLPRPEAWAFANSLVVIGDDGVLVVDTQQSPTAAQALVERIRSWTDRPVRWVVNTHWHGDHHYGNVAYRDAWPEVRFVAHPATVERIGTAGVVQREEELTRLPGAIAEAEAWLEAGSLPDGRALDDELRSAVEYSLRLRRHYFEELGTLEVVRPEPWVTAARRIDLGGRVVEVIPMGPAHTRGDVVVRVPDVGIVAVGDLLESTAPPWIEGVASMSGWADALGRLAGYPDSVFLPAHGRVERDRSLLDEERALFGDVVSGGRGDHRPFFARLGLDERAATEWWEAARIAVESEWEGGTTAGRN